MSRLPRVALVGVGDAGAHHARALGVVAGEGGLVWSALVARDAARGAAFRDKHGVPTSVALYPSLTALLDARACDAVVLATPDGVHAEQVEEAAARGVHVLVEKPLALSRTEGLRAIAAASRAGVHLAVGYHLRHHRGHRIIAQRLDELVGRPRSMFVRWAWPDPAIDGWRARGEGARFWSLAALGTHAIDLVFSLTDARLERVTSVLERTAAGTDRAAEVTLGLQGGMLAHVSVAVTHRAISRVLVTGDAGEIEALGTLGARGDGSLSSRPPRGEPAAITFDVDNPYAEQLRRFVEQLPIGFSPDPRLVDDLEVLDRIAGSSDITQLPSEKS